MIKVNSKPYRKTTADWIYLDGGAEKTEKITVEYYTLSVRQIKESQADLEAKKKEDPDGKIWLSDLLLPRLHALPELVDQDEKSIEITLEFLESQDVRNLNNIHEAIKADENPK